MCLDVLETSLHQCGLIEPGQVWPSEPEQHKRRQERKKKKKQGEKMSHRALSHYCTHQREWGDMSTCVLSLPKPGDSQ